MPSGGLFAVVINTVMGIVFNSITSYVIDPQGWWRPYRIVTGAAATAPLKPVGPELAERADGASMPNGGSGWQVKINLDLNTLRALAGAGHRLRPE
jgi:hypothetical protein